MIISQEELDRKNREGIDSFINSVPEQIKLIQELIDIIDWQNNYRKENYLLPPKTESYENRNNRS